MRPPGRRSGSNWKLHHLLAIAELAIIAGVIGWTVRGDDRASADIQAEVRELAREIARLEDVLQRGEELIEFERLVTVHRRSLVEDSVDATGTPLHVAIGHLAVTCRAFGDDVTAAAWVRSMSQRLLGRTDVAAVRDACEDGLASTLFREAES